MSSPSSSSHKIQPANYGGYGKVPGEPQGGLLNRTFNTICPPIVTPDTIILAVCGPNDFAGNAHPSNDGFFLSDFYLFHHLFRDTSKTQYWLTCVSPDVLVRKYGEYVHGNPTTSSRKIVLDASMLDSVRDVMVYKGSDLLERFLAYVKDVAKETADTNRPILILIFGHGTEGKFSITIGGTGEFESCPILTIQKFREALISGDKNPNVALLTTSCFGGGWCQTTSLNITAMAGVNEAKELLSWPYSKSLSRCCGTRYVTGIVQVLIKKEIEGFQISSDEFDDIKQSTTYAALMKTIQHTLTQEVDVRDSNEISFAAKDDLWGTEYRLRTGFPLTNYQEKWESLKSVPKGNSAEASQTASVRLSDTVTLSTPLAEYRLKHLAYTYMKSHPGPDEAPKNHCVHIDCFHLLRGDQLSNQDLERLAGALKYRLEMTRRATEYKDRLGISFANCDECDVYSCTLRIKKDKEKFAKYLEIFRMVGKRQLFDELGQGDGHPFIKGNNYLRLVFTESGWSRQEVEVALDKLEKFQGKLFGIAAALKLS